VATSTSLRRRWFEGDRWSHHLIDPRTGEPSSSEALQVTVVAESAVLADYHAKVALLKGVEDGLRYLEASSEVEGLIVCPIGVLTTKGLGDYLAHLGGEGEKSGG
jgi:thiamine biosynthesis lipoprotein